MRSIRQATALSLFLSSPARGDELLRFKSGYEMMVVSHREEGGMIVVTLEGGGEVVALCAPLLRRAQALEEVLHTVHPAGDTPAGEAREGALEVAAR